MRDISGLDAEVVFDPDATVAVRPTAAPAPEAIDEPNWGKSDFTPSNRNIGRRAALFDLPDPSETPADPFGIDLGSTAQSVRSRLSSSFSDGSDSKKGNNRRWKGGATLRSDLRDDIVEEGEELPEEVREELTDTVLSMKDDELIAHDVWFVAVGGSTLGHAGIKEFLKEHRKDIRGAFLVNLDSIGAGDLALITSEGFADKRRTNRRIERLLSFIADDLHIPIRKAAHNWEDTDATDAMRRSVRSITVMGLDDGDNRALSQTPNDVIGAVDPGQVTQVTEMLTELIRRA